MPAGGRAAHSAGGHLSRPCGPPPPLTLCPSPGPWPSAACVLQIEDKKLQGKLRYTERLIGDAQAAAAQVEEWLLPSEPGLLEAEGMERTWRFKQQDIVKASARLLPGTRLGCMRQLGCCRQLACLRHLGCVRQLLREKLFAAAALAHAWPCVPQCLLHSTPSAASAQAAAAPRCCATEARATAPGRAPTYLAAATHPQTSQTWPPPGCRRRWRWALGARCLTWR